MAHAGGGRLSSMQTFELIQLYHDHAPLWDVRNQLYKDRNVRNTAYMSIQLEFEMSTKIKLSVPAIKTKLQSFRTQFGKELNLLEKSKKSGAGADEMYTPKYEFYDSLLFLQPVICKRAWTLTWDDTSNNNNNYTEHTQQTHDSDSSEEVPVQHEDAAADIVSDTTITPKSEVEDGQGGSVGQQAVKRNIVGGRTPGDGKKRKEAAPGGAFLDTFSSYLQESETRRDDRRKEAARKKDQSEQVNTGTLLWANNLAQQIDEITDERSRKFLKIRVMQLVIQYQLEDLNNYDE